MLARLLLRTLPGEFSENSSFTWFPLQTPPSMEKYLRELGQEKRYSFARPGSLKPVVFARSYIDAEQILKSVQFKAPSVEKAKAVVNGPGFVAYLVRCYCGLILLQVFHCVCGLCGS